MSCGAGEAISSVMGCGNERTAVQAVEDRPGGEREDALSRKEFTECCPFNLESALTHSFSQSNLFAAFLFFSLAFI